jgi:hypothetical protein
MPPQLGYTLRAAIGWTVPGSEGSRNLDSYTIFDVRAKEGNFEYKGINWSETFASVQF